MVEVVGKNLWEGGWRSPEQSRESLGKGPPCPFFHLALTFSGFEFGAHGNGVGKRAAAGTWRQSMSFPPYGAAKPGESNAGWVDAAPFRGIRAHCFMGEVNQGKTRELRAMARRQARRGNAVRRTGRGRGGNVSDKKANTHSGPSRLVIPRVSGEEEKASGALG